MKLTILVENKGLQGLETQHGLSMVIEHQGKTILFDAGGDDMFLRNAEKLNVDLAEINTVVLSHGHWDHGNGLVYLADKELIMHPDAVSETFRQADDKYIGVPRNLKNSLESFRVVATEEPYWLTDSMVFLGEIPRENDFESKRTTFKREDGSPDFVASDTAMAFVNEEGIIVVAGCSHAGIINIVDYAKKITGIEKVIAVIGGFHLTEMNQVAERTLGELKARGIQKLYPMHCTCDEVITYMQQNSGDIDVIRIVGGERIAL